MQKTDRKQKKLKYTETSFEIMRLVKKYGRDYDRIPAKLDG